MNKYFIVEIFWRE